jgi:hypothetical protein
MDNASNNKCFTVIAAMAALCLLGVVKKVVVGAVYFNFLK